MAYSKKKLEAIEMRKLGMSYSQIKKELQVSKSTLSLWLRLMPLSPERIRELLYDNEQRIERCRNTKQQKRNKRLWDVYRKEGKRLLPLIKKELYIAGLMLYWGEGGKTLTSQISLSNTDPKVILFYLHWLNSALGIKKEKVKIRLHLYKDMDYEKELSYWNRLLQISTSQFTKPYVKKTTLRGLTYKTYGHGTCNVIVFGRDYYEKVMMGIKCLADSCLRGYQIEVLK